MAKSIDPGKDGQLGQKLNLQVSEHEQSTFLYLPECRIVETGKQDSFNTTVNY